MKKYLSIILACLMLMALFAACGDSSGDNGGTNGEPGGNGAVSGDKTVYIGVFQPASGDNGAGGKQETLGIEYAHYLQPTVEIAGETYNVELKIVDNQSSTAHAATAAAQLISENVSLVLGSYGSAVSIAATETFINAGVPAIGITCTNPQVTLGNDIYFRICFLDPFQGTILANFAADRFEAQTAYILTKLGDDYSAGLGNYFKEAFTALGGEVIEETFPDGNSDFSSYVANAKNEGADIFFAPVSTEAAALIIDQAAAQNLGMPILAGDTWDSNVILSAAEGKDVRVYITTFYQEGGNPEFDEGFRAWLNANPTAMANNGGDDTIAAVSAMGFDGYFVALEALRRAGTTDPKAINDVIWGVTWNGVSGPIAFDDIGDAKRDTAFIKTVNTTTGEWDFFGEARIK